MIRFRPLRIGQPSPFQMALLTPWLKKMGGDPFEWSKAQGPKTFAKELLILGQQQTLK